MSGAASGPQTSILQYRDAHGYLQEIRVTSAKAKAIEAVLRSARRADQEWRAKHVTFTDAGIDAGRVEEPKKVPRGDLGNAPEGPYFKFTWLIGASRTWNGDPVRVVRGVARCEFCGRARLPRHALCLGCTRSGRDMELPTVPRPVRPKPPKFRPAVREEAGLKGGLTGKR